MASIWPLEESEAAGRRASQSRSHIVRGRAKARITQFGVTPELPNLLKVQVS